MIFARFFHQSPALCLVPGGNKRMKSHAWEQRKLGDIADITGGGTPSTSNNDYWDGNINWYSPAEISNQIFLNSSQRKITELGFSSCSAKRG